MIVESWVNCDVPGMRSIDYAGATSGTITVTGWMTFRSLLAALSSALQAASVDYTIAWDSATDRITATKNSGTNYAFTLESAGMRDAWGFADVGDWNSAAASFSAAEAPDAIVPVFGARLTRSTSARSILRREYSPGRARHLAWGGGTLHTVGIECTSGQADRLTAGPCATGRIRIGASGASSAMSSSVTDGYLEGAITAATKPRSEGPIAAVVQMQITLHCDTALSTPADFDVVWGSLARGYSLVSYARIEGVPFVFSERALFLGDSNHAESATLVVGERSPITYSLDRERGICGATSMRLGILDPDDDLGLFSTPTRTTKLTAQLDYNDTTAAVGSVTGFSTGFYVGTEYCKFSGTSGGTSFTGLTRGNWGPAYTYRVGAPLGWGSVSDKPAQWAGRKVELSYALVDCYGNAVSTAMDDAYSRHVWSGIIAAQPAYEAGVWVLDCEPLLGRLTEPVGVARVGKSIPWGEFQSEAQGPAVVFPADAVIEIRLVNGATDESTAVEMSSLSYSSTEYAPTGYTACSYLALVDAVVRYARAWILTLTGPPNVVKPLVTGTKVNGSQWAVTIRESAQGFGVPDGTLYLGPMRTDGGLVYCWSRVLSFQGDALSVDANASTGLKVYAGDFDTGLDGTTAQGVVLSASDETSILSGNAAWQTTNGVAVIKGDGEELISYRAAVTSGGRICLAGIERQQSASDPADIFKPGREVESYIRVTGTLGQQCAKVLESYTGASDRGAYDTLTEGYGLTDDDVSETAVAETAGSLAISAAVSAGDSFADALGQLCAAQGYTLALIREESRLKLGLRSIDPFGAADVTIGDEDLRTDQVPQVRERNPAPNVVTLTPASIAGSESSSTRVMIAEAIAAQRGAHEVEFAIPYISSGLANLLVQMWAIQAMASRQRVIAYTLHVTPERDYLAGQTVEINTTHPALYDVVNGTIGLQGRGTILESSRTPDGDVRLTVLVRGDSMTGGPLCPVSAVTAVNVGSKIITTPTQTAPGGRAIWEAGSDVLVYQAGVSGNYDTIQVSSVNSGTLTLASIPAWLTSSLITDEGSVFVTYPADNATNATTLQNVHVHNGDGSQWL